MIRDPFILFLLVGCFFWKLTLTNQYTAMDGPDNAQQVLPWYAFEAQQIRHARLPLWDPHDWGGQSLIGQGQPGVCFPLNWILFATGFGNHAYTRIVHAVGLDVFCIHYFGALFMYWLARDLRRTRFASIVAGLAFTTCAYMGSITWPQKLDGAIWAPLTFLFFLRVYRGLDIWRNSAFTGACLGASFLSGHHEVCIFIGFAVFCAWLWLLWEERRSPGFRALAGALVVFGCFTFLISAVQILPELEYGRRAWRWVGAKNPTDWHHKVPYSAHADLSFGLRSLIGIVLPWFSEREQMFLGWTLLITSCIGMITFWRERMTKVLLSVGIGALLFALGKNNILHGVIYSLVPMMEKARTPGFAMLLFGFVACVFLAFGLDTVGEFAQLAPAISRRLFQFLMAAGMIFLALALVSFGAPFRNLDPNFLTLCGFAALGCAALLYACWNRSITLRSAQVLLVVLMVIELGNVTTYAYPNIDQGWPFLEPLGKYGDIADFMKSQKDGSRIEIDSASINYNFGDWYGVDTFTAYLASITQNVFWVYEQSPYWCHMLFGAKYYAGTKPQGGNQQLVFTSRDGVPVYRMPDALPRFWITHHLDRVSEQEGARRIHSGSNLREAAFTFGPAPSLPACQSAGEAKAVSLKPEEQTVAVNSDCPAMLVDADAYYPGWRATVDGKAAKILEVYGALRGVEIPAGRHSVTFRYRPASVLIGFVLTVLGCAGVVVLAVRRWKKVPFQD